MRGYKVFNPDWTCRGYQFEVGKTFTEDVKPECVNSGFHFCFKITDCFKWYDFDPNNKVAEVEALGDIDTSNNDSMCSTNKIHIIRELTWHEVLDLANSGKACTGLRNSGYNNSGNGNTGNRNSGNHNSNNYNSGNCNHGDKNSGDCNCGSRNSGHFNRGSYNSGSGNRGDKNSGDDNKGNYNSGNYNKGDYNSGDWNKTYFSNGCFNTELPNIFLFNKLSNWTYYDWFNSNARDILRGCPSNITAWVWNFDMTDEERQQHPEYSATGGFLRDIDEEIERQAWWDGLIEEDKDIIMSLPNFDKDIFKEITGIDVDMEELW